MTHVRHLLRDRMVLTALAGLAVFAAATAAAVSWDTSVRSNERAQIAATRAQIERSHAVSTAVLQIAEGDTARIGELDATLGSLRRTQNALLTGDPATALPGVTGSRLADIVTAADGSLARLETATAALLAGPRSLADAGDVIAAASEFRSKMGRAAATLSSRTADHAVLAKRLQLAAIAIGFSIAIAVLLLAAHSRQRSGAAHRARRAGELDQLTGLVRRHRLRDHLIRAMHQHEQVEGFIALLLIEVRPPLTGETSLDRAGRDRLTQDVARRLRETVRSTDLIARTGNHEFGVVIDRSPRVDDAGRVAGKLLDALGEPFSVAGDRVRLRPAIGIALSDLDASNADELLDRCGQALDLAISRSKPAYRYFSPDMRPTGPGRTQLADALRSALDRSDELWIAYQPKIRLNDGAVVGFEALVRWRHPTLGPLLPDEFVPIAEESDLIEQLGSWVVEEVCGQLASWARSGSRPIPVSINISTHQFRNGDLDRIVSDALRRHRLRADLVEIEITEGVLMDDQDAPLAHMEKLRRLGVRISVDDFGTGYSSLSYLKRFPIDTVKIDRSFISELSEGNEDAAISTAIISLAHSLDLDVVAEGVETAEQLDILIDLGCDAAQGFLFSEPVPADAADVLSRRNAAVG